MLKDTRKYLFRYYTGHLYLSAITICYNNESFCNKTIPRDNANRKIKSYRERKISSKFVIGQDIYWKVYKHFGSSWKLIKMGMQIFHLH